ncbi:TetR/AcrR family transcriptional regulator [Siculibacillus lacustris]|uniref:TetR/AcrR family transcriptional regulator n=1 Tax=Siculibacillus lacustris TaxID=1549641 RepID=A0A4Q9VI31_9HYPH|nr:TetR/AcrR family transcriptional regulator [Siculibacillus lacustris]TBW34847.1 TetR/AcrR family transcriptional regulator [Siculibacillus lacustris]
MGHSRAEKATTHQKIVEVAAKRFREVGLDGIGVADVMKEAGLTVGGFYKHFGSRDDLVIEALTEAFKEYDAAEIKPECAAHFVNSYLTAAHRDEPGCGCPMGALVADVGRAAPAAREVYTERVKMNVAFFEKLLGGEGGTHQRSRALLLLSACLGALGLSRAVCDPALSDEVLAAVAEQLTGLIAGNGGSTGS